MTLNEVIEGSHKVLWIHTDVIVSAGAFFTGEGLSLVKVPISKHSYAHEDLRPERLKNFGVIHIFSSSLNLIDKPNIMVHGIVKNNWSS